MGQLIEYFKDIFVRGKTEHAALNAFEQAGFVLTRVSYLERTVRYEWVSGHGKMFSPAFHATLQEWERAVD